MYLPTCSGHFLVGTCEPLPKFNAQLSNNLTSVALRLHASECHVFTVQGKTSEASQFNASNPYLIELQANCFHANDVTRGRTYHLTTSAINHQLIIGRKLETSPWPLRLSKICCSSASSAAQGS